VIYIGKEKTGKSIPLLQNPSPRHRTENTDVFGRVTLSRTDDLLIEILSNAPHIRKVKIKLETWLNLLLHAHREQQSKTVRQKTDRACGDFVPRGCHLGLDLASCLDLLFFRDSGVLYPVLFNKT
jgi:hypothetical protein